MSIHALLPIDYHERRNLRPSIVQAIRDAGRE